MGSVAFAAWALMGLSFGCSSSSTKQGASTDAGAEADAPAPVPATFQIGAASIDITPPLLGAASPPSAFASCDEKAFNGKRTFAFEEPYTDTMGKGLFEDGDAYCDANKNGRYDGIFLAGGAGMNRQPTKVLDPISASAVVFESADKSQQVAIAIVDSIGLPLPEITAMVTAAKAKRPSLSEVLVSSTHDESAPDPIGLWGPSQMESGVNDYYMTYLAGLVGTVVDQAAGAVVAAHLRFAEGQQPPSFQTVFSSFPFVFDPSVMVMQAVSAADSKTVVFTLANYAFHAEGYGYSSNPEIAVSLSADWPGALRKGLEAKYGGVGIGMAGLLGSIETPNVYPGATVSETPVNPIDAGNENYAIFPNPKGVAALPVGSIQQTNAIGQDMAAAAALAFDNAPAHWSIGGGVRAVVVPFCVEVENFNFLLAADFGLFNRAITCNGVKGQTPTSVAVFDLGDAQIAYLPGEVFPFTILRGFLGANDMPFPSEPMTPWIASAMTGRFPFFAGLGTDMLGYLMPPNDFVGEPGELNTAPWGAWDKTHTNENDRFGWIHNDDGESVGPHAAVAMSTAALKALNQIDPEGPANTTVATGRFLDAEGHDARSPFPASGFTGAVGVWVLPAGSTTFKSGSGSYYLLASHESVGGRTGTSTAGGFIDSHGQPQSAGYDIATRGVWLAPSEPGGVVKRVFVDTFPGD
jgi:hypothetical protein